MLYQIFVYVPIQNVQEVKEALFDAGAGRYENYDRCSWETSGMGQFRPLEGANPFLGTLDAVHTVEETRVETVCTPEFLHGVLIALKKAHPYEEPAYGVIELKTIEDFSE